MGDPNAPTTSQPQQKKSQVKKGRTLRKLTLALLIAVVVNVPAAEAIFIPLSLQPGGPLQAGVPYIFRVGDAAHAPDSLFEGKAKTMKRKREYGRGQRVA
ncbi:MAG: hypothetical protein C5B58_02285 [Acidobacteria bacterium]|nr:MAG: hypothetical protein C5B58_02285 [Acidobacteriota bacterium]